jgi:hypothetical protein
MKKRVAGALDRFSQSLGAVPSMAFALVFLTLIPGFAIVYSLMPYQFYHSTIAYEGVLDADADRILGRLRAEIIAEFEKVHGAFQKDGTDWSLNVTSLGFHNLKPQGTQVGFTITVPLDGRGEHQGDQIFLGVDVLMDVGVSMTSWKTGDRWPTIIKMPTFVPQEPLLIDLHELFPYHFDKSLLPASASTETVFLPVSEPLNDDITGFANAVSGFPSRATGSYARMFYFSAVTITTLGYGDIVPITTAARLLVAAEAILGIVLIGLFINSLFKESSQNHYTRKGSA